MRACIELSITARDVREEEDEEGKNGTVEAIFGAQFKMNSNYTRIAANLPLSF